MFVAALSKPLEERRFRFPAPFDLGASLLAGSCLRCADVLPAPADHPSQGNQPASEQRDGRRFRNL